MTCSEIELLEKCYQRMKIESYNGDLDSGKYRVRVDDVRLHTTVNGYLQLVWDLEILTPPHLGSFVTRRNTISKSQTALARLYNDLKLCGVILDKIADLEKEETLVQLMGIELLARIVNSNGNTTVYFLKRLRRGEMCRPELDDE